MRNSQTTRRRFAFWIGLGLFQLSEKLSADGLDELAAAGMRLTEPTQVASITSKLAHWTPAENRTWRWYQRENFIDGRWQVTGVTRPVRKTTSAPYELTEGYLDESLVPDNVRASAKAIDRNARTPNARAPVPVTLVGQPDPMRKARHGRPPSQWLRSLEASELRIWLKTIVVPEAQVEGMSYFTHLTRDHFFDGEKIGGLIYSEQAQLHAAAHAGY